MINDDDSTLKEYILRCQFMSGMLSYACLSLFFAAAASSYIWGFDVVKLSQFKCRLKTQNNGLKEAKSCVDL